jgi:hypothetical protein
MNVTRSSNVSISNYENGLSFALDQKMGRSPCQNICHLQCDDYQLANYLVRCYSRFAYCTEVKSGHGDGYHERSDSKAGCFHGYLLTVQAPARRLLRSDTGQDSPTSALS